MRAVARASPTPKRRRGNPDPKRVADNRGYIAFLLSEFTVPHLLSTYKAFRGDMVMAIVLGEIGQHNVRRFYNDPAFRPGTGTEQALASQRGRHPSVHGCNALSISRATGLARETVRRKVVKLLRHGLVVRDARGHLLIAPAIVERFEGFNEVSLANFLDVATRLTEVLGITLGGIEAADDAAARRPRRS